MSRDSGAASGSAVTKLHKPVTRPVYGLLQRRGRAKTWALMQHRTPFAMHPNRRAVLVGLGGFAAAQILTPVAASAALTGFRPKGQASIDHSAFDGLLTAYVKPDAQAYNRVDYRGLKARHGALKAYLAALEAVDPVSLSRNEAYAYWINLYNAKTLDVVLEAFPVSSIKKINLGGSFLFGAGPWKAKLLTVNGAALSLDDVEHEIVRPLFKDEMTHYGLNCAAYTCPNLATQAYTGANVTALLRRNGADYVNHPRGVSISNDRITASKVYSWYSGDFGGKGKLKGHWAALAAPDKAARIATASISRYEYDWTLNTI